MDPAGTLSVPADEIVLGAEGGGEAHVYPESLLRVWHIGSISVCMSSTTPGRVPYSITPERSSTTHSS